MSELCVRVFMNLSTDLIGTVLDPSDYETPEDYALKIVSTADSMLTERYGSMLQSRSYAVGYRGLDGEVHPVALTYDSGATALVDTFKANWEARKAELIELHKIDQGGYETDEEEKPTE